MFSLHYHQPRQPARCCCCPCVGVAVQWRCYFFLLLILPVRKLLWPLGSRADIPGFAQLRCVKFIPPPLPCAIENPAFGDVKNARNITI